MKPTRLFISLLALSLAGLTAGCGKETPDHQESSADDAHAEGHDNNGEEGHDDHDEGGGESSATFKEGIGLVFPSDVLAAMGVRTAEVEERLLPLTIDLVAQVYDMLASPRAVAPVSPESARNLTVGLSASLPTTAEARLTEISRTLEAAANRVELIFDLPSRAEPYQLGETLKLRLKLAPDAPKVSVPRAALLDTALGTFVYLINGEAFLRTPVTTGAMDDDIVEITDGVFEGDTVVTSPVSQLWLTELRLTKGGGHSH